MRLFLTILAACLMLETAHAANFPYIRLNAKTNRLSDSGTAATFNGTALVLSTEAGITNALGRAISGTGPLLSASTSMRFVSTNYTISTNDFYLSVVGAWTNTLPAANSVVAGKWFIIKAATTNGATVWLSAGDTIDYSITNESLPFPTSRNYMSDGTNNWQRW